MGVWPLGHEQERYSRSRAGLPRWQGSCDPPDVKEVGTDLCPETGPQEQANETPVSFWESLRGAQGGSAGQRVDQ